MEEWGCFFGFFWIHHFAVSFPFFIAFKIYSYALRVLIRNYACRLAPLCIELEERLLLSIIDFSRNASLRLKSRILRHSSYNGEVLDNDPEQFINVEQDLELKSLEVSKLPNERKDLPIFPSVLPVGAPWQKNFLFAKRQKKIYVELLTLAPLRLTVR